MYDGWPLVCMCVCVCRVQWESTLRWMVQRGEQGAGSHARLFELGPGQQIKAMVRRMDGTVWKAFNNIQA